MTEPIRILGLDPGLRYTGWGLIESANSQLFFGQSGRINVPASGGLAARLAILHRELTAIITTLAPHEVAVEETFVNVSPTATLKLGQARGVVLTAPALLDIPVFEYAPNQVKKTVVGAGHAGKQQIHMMVKMLLPKARPETDDEADALAIAICHAHHRGRAHPVLGAQAATSLG